MQTVELTDANTNYNLLALILNALGYTLPNLTSAPMVQVGSNISGFDYPGTPQSYWPNPVREFHYEGNSANGAGVININNSAGEKGDQVQALQSNVIRSTTQSIDLSTVYVSSTTAAVELNVMVDM